MTPTDRSQPRPGRRRAPWPILAAAAIVAACVGVSTWVGLAAVVHNNNSHRHRSEVATLENARALIAARQREAATTAATLAGNRAIVDAFARHDMPKLAAFAQSHRSVTFTLWNGRTVGRPPTPGVDPTLNVYGTHGVTGQIIVSAAPDRHLLERALRGARHLTLFYVARGHLVASAPATRRRPTLNVSQLRSGQVLNLDGTKHQPTFLFATTAAANVPLANFWPWLAAVIAGGCSYLIFVRRERRRMGATPPRGTRNAIAIVGQTLAATHNVEALLPVILRASLEATNAAGGTITADGKTLARQGTITANTDTIRTQIAAGSDSPWLLTIYAAAGGFDTDAREAAAWVADQAGIAIENARLHKLVREQAATDELTGLANRRRFLTELEGELARSQRSNASVAVILADLDDFKTVNDTWGHATGDAVLRQFATILRSMIRSVDLPVRLGGEEFAVLLPETDVASAREVAERIRVALYRSTLRTSDRSVKITASFGVSSFPENTNADDLLAEADRRLYEAKRQGKNRVTASAKHAPAEN